MKMKSHHSVAPPGSLALGVLQTPACTAALEWAREVTACTASWGLLNTVTPDHAPFWLEQASSHLHPPQPIVPHTHTVSSLFCPAHLTLASQKGAISFWKGSYFSLTKEKNKSTGGRSGVSEGQKMQRWKPCRDPCYCCWKILHEQGHSIPDKLKNKIRCYPAIYDRHCWHNTNVYKFTKDKCSLGLRALSCCSFETSGIS